MRKQVLAGMAFFVLCTDVNAASAQIAPDGGAPSSPQRQPAGTEDHPARVSGGVMAGMRLHKEDPVYPEEAKAKQMTGSVVLNALITPEGTIARLDAITGPEILRKAALDAVQHWTYRPFLLNGNPVFVQTTITVMFPPASQP